VRGCGVRLVVLLLLFLSLFDNEGAVAMNKYSIDLEKLNLKRGYGFNKESENLSFGGLGSTSTNDEEAPDPYPEYDENLKMALQSARDISFTTVEDGQKSDAQKKFDKTKFLQGIVDASTKSSPAPFLRPANMSVAVAEIQTATEDSFYAGIKLAEGTHGKTSAGLYIPEDTNDAAEKNKKVKSKDVGYGHKVKDSEKTSKKIYGIPFINAAGNYIPLTEEQVETIYKEDMRVNLELARKAGWDKELKKIGTTWEDLPEKFKLPLISLAYNVGGSKAGSQWKDVLSAAKERNIINFASELRRKDGGKNTKGMDNRVIKELKAANLISDSSEVKSVLGLTDI